MTLSRILEIAETNRYNAQSGEFSEDGCALESFAGNAYDTVREEGGCHAQATYAREMTMAPVLATKRGFHRIATDTATLVTLVGTRRNREEWFDSKDGGETWTERTAAGFELVRSGLAKNLLGLWLSTLRNGRTGVSA